MCSKISWESHLKKHWTGVGYAICVAPELLMFPALLHIEEIVQDFPGSPATVQVMEFSLYCSSTTEEIWVCPGKGHQRDIYLTHALS